jgi:hypothetical protein
MFYINFGTGTRAETGAEKQEAHRVWFQIQLLNTFVKSEHPQQSSSLGIHSNDAFENSSKFVL